MTIDPNNGRLLADRYRLIDLAGKGAMGRVYRAEDTLLGNVTVAVKFLAQTLLNQKMRERFEREATICALLGEKSMNIIRVRDYGVDEFEIPFYVMEFLEGKSLSDLIRDQPLPLTRFFPIMRQICLGMEAAHQGIKFKGDLCRIIHRDLKPSNILILEDANIGELVKILDFGIAKLAQEGGQQTSSFMGTLAYCSPEQMEGKELDPRSDIYSLGIMMYEMLTTDMPIAPQNNTFGGWYEAHHHQKPRSIPSYFKIPSEVLDVVMKCLAKSPQQRPQTAAEIWHALEPCAIRLAAKQTEKPVAEPSPETATKIIEIPSALVPSIAPQTSQSESSLPRGKIEDICRQSSWSADKPLEKIVFPRLIPSQDGTFATLWTMLESDDIDHRRICSRYNQFLFLTMPHPMLLWLTVLYNRSYGPRWLPCYLDMKTALGQKVAYTLAETGMYYILLFGLGQPQKCQNLMSTSIDPKQCQMLHDWATQGKTLPAGQPNVSKKTLKQELDKIKPKILLKLENS